MSVFGWIYYSTIRFDIAPNVPIYKKVLAGGGGGNMIITIRHWRRYVLCTDMAFLSHSSSSAGVVTDSEPVEQGYSSHIDLYYVLDAGPFGLKGSRKFQVSILNS